jgi:hypothetical protein
MVSSPIDHSVFAESCRHAQAWTSYVLILEENEFQRYQAEMLGASPPKGVDNPPKGRPLFRKSSGAEPRLSRGLLRKS